jgi:ubiquitin carboxyl-terminal hydrolase 4/11/15
MNSTLQCLFNTPILRDYFTKDQFLPHINRKNPLGWQGKVAEEYGKLLKQIWSGRYRSIPPKKFKKTIGEFQPRFSGYQQQDSSELLSFLLDGLHEDLNRVIDKPPTNKVESKGRLDDVVAEEAWKTHRLRNQSVIVDNVQGQLKSRLICPTCKLDSTTFDPFTFLSLPLPHSKEKTINVTLLLFTEPKPKPQRVEVTVPKKATTNEVKDAVIKIYAKSLTREQLVVVEVYSNRFEKIYKAGSLAEWNRGDNIWVYGLAAPVLEKNVTELKDVQFPVFNYSKVMDSDGSTTTLSSFGSPSIITLQQEMFESVPSDVLRNVIIKGAVLPFASHAKGSDYQIVVFEPKKHLPLLEIKDEKTPIHLRKFTDGTRFIFAILWNEDGKSAYEEIPEMAVEAKGTNRDEGVVTLNDCLDLLVKDEVLRESEAWYCSNCKARKCASKKFDLWKLPNVLIVHLKRFDFNSGYREKLETLVEFPLEGLDLSHWCIDKSHEYDQSRGIASDNYVYDLYAVSNHYGGMGGGHYTACARNYLDKQWYNFDDAHVSLVTDPHRVCVTSAAYVLFYVKQKVI